jgi:hypothetical protein
MEEVVQFHGVVPKEGDVEDIRHGWTVFIAFDESGLSVRGSYL